MTEKDSASETTRIESPSGLDLNPLPPRTVRVSKRAAGVLMAIVAVVLGLFAYGGYKRQKQQMATLANANSPQNVSPATAAGAEILKNVATGITTSSAQRNGSSEPGILQPPTDLQAMPPNTLQQQPLQSNGQVFVRQAPAPIQPVIPPVPQVHEATPEERHLIRAYEREQQAIAAPTTMKVGFGDNISTRNNTDDTSQAAALVQAL